MKKKEDKILTGAIDQICKKSKTAFILKSELTALFLGINLSCEDKYRFSENLEKLVSHFQEMPHPVRSDYEFVSALSFVVDARINYEIKNFVGSNNKYTDVIDDIKEKYINEIWEIHRKAVKWDKIHEK